jgi:hypothetical protein
MLIRYLMLAIAVGGTFGLFVAPASAAPAATLTRRDIRAMPILERPSRPGHFYGNAVRRNYSRQVGAVR